MIPFDPTCFIPGMQGWFNTPKSVKIIQNINIIILLDVGKSFGEVSYPFRKHSPPKSSNWRNEAQQTEGYVQETYSQH